MSGTQRSVSENGSSTAEISESSERNVTEERLDKLNGNMDEPSQRKAEEEPEEIAPPEDLNTGETLVGSSTHQDLEELALHLNVKEDLEIQQWSDGSCYKGSVAMNVKRGFGEFKWANGESYVGEFYKDHHHGKGVYTWPDGSKFTGYFYLSRKEGYGTITFTDGRNYKGLYKSDVRFGPGFETYNDACQDVGIWLGNHLIRLCTALPGSISISSFPEFCHHFKEKQHDSENHTENKKNNQTKDPFEYRYKILLLEDHFTLPDRIYSYSSDMDHLPITPSLQTEFDQHFYKEGIRLEESSDDISASMHCTNEMRKMYLHVNKHRNSPEHLKWDMCSIINNDREHFGPKGPGERVAEQFIMMSGSGNYETVSTILRHDLAHVDVSDNCGQTALHFATVNGHNKIINLLLDNGADVNKSNDEGLSALSLCLMLLYNTKSFWPNVAERSLPPNKEEANTLLVDNSETDSSHQDIDMNNAVLPNTEECSRIINKSGLCLSDLDVTPNFHRNENLKSTMNLLLLRGADPNICSIPMYPLFFATKAADVNTVRLLLECGARTDVRLFTQHGSLTPLHIAAALPLAEGIRITEILLHAAADVNASAEDEDYVYDQDRLENIGSVLGFSMKGGHDSGLPLYNYFERGPCVPVEGGRTPLHVACEREDNYKFAKDTISLLLAHGAKLNILWSGHSPLSLAIASGNDLAVKELLANGADPNLPLSKGVGSALCAAVNITYEKKRTLPARIALVDRLIKAGADILMPIEIRRGKRSVLGTATDYAYYMYFQDKRIAHTPYHALLPEERDIYNSRKQLLDHLGSLTREAVTLKEQEWEKHGIVRGSDVHRETKPKPGTKQSADEGSAPLPQKTFFKYCYQCGRSLGVKLTPCLRCYSVYTCSKQCKKKSWDELHKDECQQLSGKHSGKMSPSRGTRSQMSLHKWKESSHHDHRALTSQDDFPGNWKITGEMSATKGTRNQTAQRTYYDLSAYTNEFSGKMFQTRTQNKASGSLRSKRKSIRESSCAHRDLRVLTGQDCVPGSCDNYSYN